MQEGEIEESHSNVITEVTAIIAKAYNRLKFIICEPNPFISIVQQDKHVNVILLTHPKYLSDPCGFV